MYLMLLAQLLGLLFTKLIWIPSVTILENNLLHVYVLEPEVCLSHEVESIFERPY